jgi:uncharacterized protein (TIGR02569 family)
MNSPIPPSKEVLNAYGITQDPIHLKGGQGMTWRAGNTVLKPLISEEETVWRAELIETLPQDHFCTARYKKTQNQKWVYNGWEALEYIEGLHLTDHWKEKIAVCNGFNALLANVKKPSFIDKRTHPWAIAGKMVWDEMLLQYDNRLTSYVDRITKHFSPVSCQNQIVHGDITGNMLFAAHLPPGIIDFTPVWRPKEYALAILIVDALTWEGADESIFDYLTTEENMFQYLLRAALFRTLVTSEFYRQHGIDRFSEIEHHERVLMILLEHKKNLS